MARSDPAIDPLPGQIEPSLPSEEHPMLRGLVREFLSTEVGPQAASHDHPGRRNVDLLRRAGDLGLLGVTVPAEIGGGTLESHRKNPTRDVTRELAR